MTPEPETTSPTRTRVRWIAPFIGGLLVLAVAMSLRFLTDAQTLDATWDEPAMHPIVRQLVRGGWGVENSLDYEDTKGPAFFWTYAGIAEFTGDSLANLRTLTTAFFVISGLLCAIVCVHAFKPDATTQPTIGAVALVTALFVVLPYQAVLGQLFMSEPSFVAASLLLILIYIDSLRGQSRFGPVLFCLILTLVLHHRVHIVALAGAICLVSWWRDGRASWPWWWACIAAGLLRLPLMLRWDGLVSPLYQSRYGLGFQPDNLAYLAIAALPYTWITLATIMWDRVRRSRWVLALTIAGLGGAVLGLAAAPDLGLVLDESRYLGFAASLLRLMPEDSSLQVLVMRLGVALGVAGLVSVVAVAFSQEPDDPMIPGVLQIAGLVLVLGWLLYGTARGDVYDRYLLSFSILLPIVWIRRCPRPLVILQLLLLAGLMIWSASNWLRVSETVVATGWTCDWLTNVLIG